MKMFGDLIGLTERDKVCAEIWRFQRELYKSLCSIIDDDEITDKMSALNECVAEFYAVTRQAISSWSRGKVSGIRFKPKPPKPKSVKLVKKYFTNAPIWNIIKYSPDQPRDENGRWVDSGGSETLRDIVKLPNGRKGKLATGTKLTKIVTFAGKGSNKELRVAKYLEKQYDIPAEEWKKVREDGYVECGNNEIRHAELHWYESKKSGRVQMKVKRWFDES